MKRKKLPLYSTLVTLTLVNLFTPTSTTAARHTFSAHSDKNIGSTGTENLISLELTNEFTNITESEALSTARSIDECKDLEDYIVANNYNTSISSNTHEEEHENCTEAFKRSTVFTSLNQIVTGTPAGMYDFDIGGQNFTTYVDDNGYVQVVLDFVDGEGGLTGTSSLSGPPSAPTNKADRNLRRGMLSANALVLSLNETREVRLSTSTGNLDITTTDSTIIERVKQGKTLHRGNIDEDNKINNNWKGVNAGYANANATCVTRRPTSLGLNIFHTCGNTFGLHWIPIDSIQWERDIDKTLAPEVYFQLWVKGGKDFDINPIPNVPINENSAYTSIIPTLTGETPIGDVTYSLSGDDAGAFTINNSTGEVKMVARDFENPQDKDRDNTYKLTITAKDEFGNNDSEDWAVIVLDVTETIGFTSGSSFGDENVSTANLKVELSTTVIDDVTVNYAITGTATGSGTDYTLADGTLTINAGSTTGDITIGSIVDDALDEPDETVVVTLSSPTNASLGANTVHTYTINDNDAPPILAFDDTASNGDESAASANLAVSLTTKSGKDVTVNYTVTGTATGSGTDYTLADGTFTIMAGDETGNITIGSIVDDGLDEPDETVVVTLSSPTNAYLGSNTVHAYTINDNDAPPTLAFDDTASSGDESVPSANLAVSLTTKSGKDVAVNYTVTGTATGSGTDYTLADGTFTITAGDETGNITIGSIVDDALDEPDETVVVTLSSPTNASLGANTVHTYTINDNDATTANIAFDAIASSGDENVSSADLAVRLSTVSGTVVTVDYVVTGTATGGGTDYTLADGTFTINAGNTTGNINIGSIIDDALDEPNETVIVTLSSPVNASLGTNTRHTYTIVDNDAATSTIAFDVTTSNGDESIASADLEVSLDAVSGQPVFVDYTISGTADGSGTDYTLTDGTLIINAGTTNENITIRSILDDALDEADETVIVTLSNPVNASLGTNTQHTYTIIDNDVTSAIIAFDAIASSEDESIASSSIPVSLSMPSGKDVTVAYAVTGTATGNGTDYTLADGTLTITAGTTTGNITITSIVDDALNEPDETIIVTLSNPINASLGTNIEHVYTILDNDVQTIANFTINEIDDVLWKENNTYTSVAPSLSGDTPLGAITFSLEGADSSIFTVDRSTGVVSMPANDFENPVDANSDNVYEVSLRVTDALGNFAIESWTVTILDTDEDQLIIPTAFTPNGDEENDTWELPGLSENFIVTIFNRSGNTLFQSKGYTNPWDGSYQNQPLPAGIYYYIIKNETRQYQGFITILR